MGVATTERHAVLAMQLDATTEAMRTVTFMGRAFRVVPATLVQSQVLHNNLGPTYLPARVFTDAWAQLWNGIPVLVGPHPTLHGEPTSGRSATLWEERGVGWLFNVTVRHADNGRHASLVGEAWLDVARAEAVPEFATVLAALDAGSVVELSTGFPVSVSTENGVVNGQQYEMVLEPAGADHLVISTEFTGACSVADGCGLGVLNFRFTEVPPMSDKGSGEPTPPTRLAAFLERVKGILAQRSTEMAESWEQNIALLTARFGADVLNALPVSDYDRMAMLRTSLARKHGMDGCELVIVDVFSTEGLVVFYLHTPLGAQPPGSEYYRTTFTQAADGTFSFGEPERVRRVTAYEPVAGNAGAASATNHSPSQRPGCGCSHNRVEDPTMDATQKQELVQELTSGFATLLKPLQDKMDSVTETAVNAAKEAVTAALAPVTASLEAVNAQVKALQDAANAEKEAERKALIEALSTNERTPFTAAELEAQPVDALRKMAMLAKLDVTSFAGRGAPRSVAVNAGDEPAFIEPKPYFAKSATN